MHALCIVNALPEKRGRRKKNERQKEMKKTTKMDTDYTGRNTSTRQLAVGWSGVGSDLTNHDRK